MSSSIYSGICLFRSEIFRGSFESLPRNRSIKSLHQSDCEHPSHSSFMSKRPAGRGAPPRQRKRTRNGVSVSKEVLDLPPHTGETMRIWHMNAEDPAFRTSHTAIPKPQLPPPRPLAPPIRQDVRFEDAVLETVHTPRAMPAGQKSKPKTRKRGTRNDSVSSILPLNF